ncbi:MAG: GGDEF domain-containing protein, partial [Acidobacteriota bacterium]|nr:GGDEF domain-containing protein [Acidobacteriota bacterium]
PPATLARLAGAAAVCASPLAYSGAAVRLAYVVPFLALLTTTVVLAGILLYSTRKLALAERRSRDLASQDPLTGLPNRRAFEHAVNEALARRGGEEAGSLAIAIVDLDNFKRVNDRHGHAAGDSVLRGIAAALGAAARDEDLVARIGGDEFALIVRRGGSGAVQSLGSRCIAAVERAAGDAGFGDCLVSATVGFALCPQHGNGLEDLLHAADEALMGAKADGKRTVTCARALRATG